MAESYPGDSGVSWTSEADDLLRMTPLEHPHAAVLSSSQIVGQRGVGGHPSHIIDVPLDHHSCSSARLHAAQPRHVYGCPRATVSVRCGPMESSKVVPSVDHQELITADTFGFGLIIIDPCQDLCGQDG